MREIRLSGSAGGLETELGRAGGKPRQSSALLMSWN
jgi:hypothetical protein